MLTLSQQLDSCRRCQNRTMSLRKGILCRLTDAKPTFEKECENFVPDENVPVRIPDDKNILTSDEIKGKIPEKVYNSLIMEQNFPAAIVTGFLASIAGAGIWAIITSTTGYQVGFMAMGVGALVGIAVRIFGKGITKQFGIIGAVFSLFGCVLGNLLSFVIYIAKYYQLDFWSVFSQLSFDQISQMMIAGFSFADIVFYAIAIGEGYRFALRQITEKRLKTEFNKD